MALLKNAGLRYATKPNSRMLVQVKRNPKKIKNELYEGADRIQYTYKKGKGACLS